uniref:WD_REPEATS_REGION domain-containing protein n=1 Tax=Parastrongyloides trichosuri TaxID=131310 RepID=A0A0N4Z1R0_PARTI
MDNATFKTISVNSTWNVINETFHNFMQTEPLQTKDESTSPMENNSIQIQTEDVTISSISDISPSSIKINPKVIDKIIFFIKESDMLTEYIKTFINLQRTAKVSMKFLRTLYNLNISNILPFSIVGGRGGRVCVLYGEEIHDAWCSHTSKVVMYYKNQNKSIDLSSCPTKFLYHDQYGIIGQMNGNIILAKDGEILEMIEEHDYSISCLISINNESIISASIDGKIVLWNIKNENMKKVKEYQAKISDLPRELRQSSGKDNKRHTSVVSISHLKDQLIIGGETGALWSCTLNDMMLTPITTIGEGIEDIFLINNNILIILSSFGKILKYDMTMKILEESLYKNVISICNLDTKLVLLSENNIKIVDALTFEELLSDDKNFIDVKFDKNDNLICLDIKNNINLYTLD